MQRISDMERESRKPLCRELGVSPSIVRTMVDYTRYPQAEDVAELLLGAGEDIASLCVLDFSCLVADYAMFFARSTARAAVYDDDEAVTFAAFRFARANLPIEIFTIPKPGEALMAGRDLVIFGEVLEHLEDPLGPIRDCIGQGVRYIFTSCYPFGGEEYYGLSGHLKSAQELQSECIRLFIAHYDVLTSRDKSVLWKRRAGV